MRLSTLRRHLLKAIILSAIAAEYAEACRGFSKQSKVECGKPCQIGWEQGAGKARDTPGGANNGSPSEGSDRPGGGESRPGGQGSGPQTTPERNDNGGGRPSGPARDFPSNSNTALPAEQTPAPSNRGGFGGSKGPFSDSMPGKGRFGFDRTGTNGLATDTVGSGNGDDNEGDSSEGAGQSGNTGTNDIGSGTTASATALSTTDTGSMSILPVSQSQTAEAGEVTPSPSSEEGAGGGIGGAGGQATGGSGSGPEGDRSTLISSALVGGAGGATGGIVLGGDSSSDSTTELTGNFNNSTDSDYAEWKSTSISLMITLDGRRVEITKIAVNIDISATEGTYDVPQAPWLTCTGEQFYYQFTSSEGTIVYTDTFTIEGTDTDKTKSCIEATAPPKVCQSPKGLEWTALNDISFGYTIMQNVTNVYNQVVTTVVSGETVTKTIPTTTTATSPGGTVTQTADAQTVTSVLTVGETKVITQGGSIITSVSTTEVIISESAAATGEVPAISTPVSEVPMAGAPLVEQPLGETPTGEQPPDDFDEEWDEDTDEEDDWDVSTPLSPSASASGTPGDWDMGAASGRPKASIAVAFATAALAFALGGLLLVA